MVACGRTAVAVVTLLLLLIALTTVVAGFPLRSLRVEAEKGFAKLLEKSEVFDNNVAALKITNISELGVEGENNDPAFSVQKFVMRERGELEAVVLELRKTNAATDSCSFPPEVILRVGLENIHGYCLMHLEGNGQGRYSSQVNASGFIEILQSCTQVVPEVIHVTSEQVYRGVEAFVSISTPTECNPGEKRVDNPLHLHIRFDVRIARVHVDPNIMQIKDYWMEPCTDRLVASSRLHVVTTLILQDVPLELRFLDTCKVGDVVLKPIGPRRCDVSYEGYVCEQDLVSLECLLVATYPDSTCEFMPMGKFDIQAKLWHSSFSSATVVELTDKDPLQAKEFSGQFCPKPTPRHDVTADFPVIVTVSGSKINKPVEVKIALADDLDSSFSDSYTLRILSLVVTMEFGAYSRVFNVDDKLAMLGNPTSGYFKDGHFCRFEESSGETNSICQPFYIEKIRTNSYFRGSPPAYLVLNKGHVSCQYNNDRRSDKFVFTPSEWVFSDWHGERTTIGVQVIAKLETCSTPMTSTNLLKVSPKILDETTRRKPALKEKDQLMRTVESVGSAILFE